MPSRAFLGWCWYLSNEGGAADCLGLDRKSLGRCHGGVIGFVRVVMRKELLNSSMATALRALVARVLVCVLGCLGMASLAVARPPGEAAREEFPEKDFVCGAWLPYWGMEEGKESLAQVRTLNALSPVWYEVEADGSLSPKIKASARFLKETARKRGLKLTPSLAIFDPKHLGAIIGNPTNRRRHVDAILAEVRAHDFDGIDIDYETVAIENKEDYFLFLKSLSKGLHELGKLLSVAVLSKWGEDVDYPILPQTHEVQDWARIGALADEVRIMAYDYTLPKSRYPGPIAPNNWVEKVLEYAVTKIPREKIILGVHLYGCEWRSADAESMELKREMKDNPLGGKRAKSFTHDVIEDIRRKNKGTLERVEGESVFRYSVGGKGRAKEHRVLVFPGREGIAEKVALARKYDVGGVFFWRLGGEADLLSRGWD